MKPSQPQPDAPNDSPSACSEASGSEQAESGVAARRAYRQPTLRRLGSVRELTLGGTGFLADGGLTRRMAGM